MLDLTSNIPGTIALPLPEKFDQKIITSMLTFSDAINGTELYKRIIERLTQLEQSNLIDNKDINEVEKLIQYLPEDSDERLETSFLLSIQKSKKLESMLQDIPYELESGNLLEKVKNSISTTELDAILVENGYGAYIDLGIEGRKKIVGKIFIQKDKYLTIDDLEQALNKEIDILKATIQGINRTGDPMLLLNTLNELQLDIFLVLENEQKLKVVHQLINRPNRCIKTIAELKSAIENAFLEVN